MKAFQAEWVESSQGPVSIWDDPLEGRTYVIGADIATGKFRDMGRQSQAAMYSRDRPDFTAAVVMERDSTNHVATWHGYASPMETATYLAALGLHYNVATLAIELNGPGDAVVDHLRGVIAYPNLFRSRLLTRVDAAGVPQPGWMTNEATRHMLMGNLERALSDGVLFTRDERLIREMRRMQYDKAGKPRALNKDKDDLVFAAAIALQAVYEGTSNTATPTDSTPRHRDSWVWDHLKDVRDQAARYAAPKTRHDRLPPRRPLPARSPGMRGSGIRTRP